MSSPNLAPNLVVCPLNVTFSVAHLAGAWPGPLFDGPFTVGALTLAEDVVTEPVRLEGSEVRVPDEPGLSVTLDEDKIRHFRVDA